jgi:hypothetical protein
MEVVVDCPFTHTQTRGEGVAHVTTARENLYGNYSLVKDRRLTYNEFVEMTNQHLDDYSTILFKAFR